MPTIAIAKGKADVLPVEFSDGELAGNTQWNVEWSFLDLRQILTVTVSNVDYSYKVIEIGDVVILDRYHISPPP